MADQLEDLAFELKARRECYRRERGKWVRFTDRDRELPHEPQGFKPTFGSYAEVARKATRANEAQQFAGFIDYLFWPEVVTP